MLKWTNPWVLARLEAFWRIGAVLDKIQEAAGKRRTVVSALEVYEAAYERSIYIHPVKTSDDFVKTGDDFVKTSDDFVDSNPAAPTIRRWRFLCR